MDQFGSQSVKLYLSITIPIVIILIVLLYRNLFSTINSNIIAKPLPTVKNANMSSCGQLKSKEQYHISDYYIAASYMTPCLQSSYYGYLSNDMIRKVIQAGARMIQIPICQESTSGDSLAVCAMCEPDTMLITSLNSLDLSDVWQTILSSAFQHPITKQRITNPIFIELVINTKNPYTLDHIAETIYLKLDPLKIVDKKVRLVVPSDYDEGKWIFLEKLCKLQNKIVMFTTSPIANSEKLSRLVFHIRDTTNKSLFRKMTPSGLSAATVPTGTGWQNDYNRMLSSQSQRKTMDIFQQKYIPQLEEMMVANPNASGMDHRDIEDIGQEILNDNSVLNKTIAFNKIGITCIEPLEMGVNYDFSEAVASGCQIIYMNWQNHDSILQSYINMFTESSFILKPTSMRLQLNPSVSQDIAALYPAVEKLPIPLVGNFAQYTYNLVVLAYYNNPKLVLTNVNGNLVMANRLNPININQTFIAIPSKLPSNAGSIHLAIPNDFSHVIAVNSTDIVISSIGIDKKGLENQSWYPIQPLVPSDSSTTNNEQTLILSIQSYNKTAKRCLFYQNNKLVLANADTGNKDILNKMILQLEIIPSTVIATFTSQLDDIIKITSTGAVGTINKKNGTNTEFIIENAIARQPLKSFFNIPVRLKIRSSGKYLTQDTTGIPVINDNIPGKDNIFTLEQDISGDNMVRIVDINNKILTIIGKNGLQFTQPDKNTSSIKTLFKINSRYIVS
jgi:hypothetical protein